MAKKTGFYKHEKRQKELAKQKKKQEKQARKSRETVNDSSHSDAEGEVEDNPPSDQSPPIEG